MNKTIKHILKGILFVVIAIVVIFLCIRTYYKFFYYNDADLTTEETDILLLSQTYPTTFYFIGDTIPLDKSITTKNIAADEVSLWLPKAKENTLMYHHISDDSNVSCCSAIYDRCFYETQSASIQGHASIQR